jgi:hypothetical protein
MRKHRHRSECIRRLNKKCITGRSYKPKQRAENWTDLFLACVERDRKALREIMEAL